MLLKIGLIAVLLLKGQSALAQGETVDTILCQTDRVYYAHNNWTPETADLDCADEAATSYAETTFGVGILIHVGRDIPNDHVARPEQLGELLVQRFKAEYDVDAQFFLAQSDTLATGITYHIGDLIHGANDGTEVKTVREALDAMPEVSGLLREIWENR